MSTDEFLSQVGLVVCGLIVVGGIISIAVSAIRLRNYKDAIWRRLMEIPTSYSPAFLVRDYETWITRSFEDRRDPITVANELAEFSKYRTWSRGEDEHAEEHGI